MESVRHVKPHRRREFVEECRPEEPCERQEDTDKKLHDLAQQLHVLEWETYGPAALKRKRRTH